MLRLKRLTRLFSSVAFVCSFHLFLVHWPMRKRRRANNRKVAFEFFYRRGINDDKVKGSDLKKIIILTDNDGVSDAALPVVKKRTKTKEMETK